MKKRTSCLLLFTVLLAGCWQKSVNPFYTANDLVAEPKLAGTWADRKESDEDRTIWKFTDAGDKRWDVVLHNKNEKYEFDGRVFKLGEARFLDFESKLRAVSTVPAHHLFRLVEVGAELKLAPLNTEWVQKWLRDHPGALAHATIIDPEHRNDREKDELALLADTKALQKFVREHMDEKDFFADATVLKK
jgi:hypothetical protein